MSLPAFANGEKLFNNYAMSTSGDANSAIVDMREIIGYSVQVVWSGASATNAACLIKASNDGINFVEVASIAIDAASGNSLVNVERAMYAFLMLTFDKNSETTGLLTAQLCGKRV